MIDPSMDTVEITPEAEAKLTMMDLMQIQIDNLTTALEQEREKIVDLTNKAAAATDNWEYARDRLQSRDRQVYELEDFLKSNHSDMDESHVEEIAGIFGISLTVDYDVTINVTLSGTVTVPMDYDMDDLESDLQATIDTHHYGNSSVYVDLSEDRMEIDWQES